MSSKWSARAPRRLLRDHAANSDAHAAWVPLTRAIRDEIVVFRYVGDLLFALAGSDEQDELSRALLRRCALAKAADRVGGVFCSGGWWDDALGPHSQLTAASAALLHSSAAAPSRSCSIRRITAALWSRSTSLSSRCGERGAAAVGGSRAPVSLTALPLCAGAGADYGRERGRATRQAARPDLGRAGRRWRAWIRGAPT